MTADAVDRRQGVLSDDWFPGAADAGTVIGSRGPGGAVRRGVDAEGLVGIDNGALRFEPLARPGWGREGIAYGPFPPEPGLAFAAHVLNGHHASQTYYFHEPSRRVRLRRWLSDARRGRLRRPRHHENLAVGLFPEAVPADPLARAHAFVMHAATEDNGELWHGSGGRRVRLVRGVLNVPMIFVVVLRHDGEAAYYTSSLPAATGAAAYPSLRPLGVGLAAGGTPPLFAGIQQRILGEVGYRVATRVYGARVAVVPSWRDWFGSACLADRLGGAGPVGGTAGDHGPAWHTPGIGPVRTSDGARAPGADPVGASAHVDAPVGLLRARLRAPGEGRAELRWRGHDHREAGVAIVGAGVELDGVDEARQSRRFALPDRRDGERVVQVLDDGSRLVVHVDGEVVGDRWWPSAGCPREVGFVVAGGATVRDVEAHPAEIALPPEIDLGPVWAPPRSRTTFDERFDATGTLDGALTPSGGRRWHLAEGAGAVELRADRGARVVASREHPNPGRTIFTVDWDDPGFADVSIEMTPPGTSRGHGEAGRVGMVFWQDPQNYLVVNVYVDDDFDGASISTFYRIRGHENMYDAVWTLVRGMTYGRRCTLRTAFDGERFLSWANDEPALVRALTDVYPDAPRLHIRKLGLVVNEEWGDDTGSVIHRYAAGVRAEDDAPSPHR